MNSNQQPPEEIEEVKVDNTAFYSENEFCASKDYDLGNGLKISARKIQPSKKPRGVLAE